MTLIQVPLRQTKITDAPWNADPTGEVDATEAVNWALERVAVVEVPPGRYRLGQYQELRFGEGRERVGALVPSDRRLWGHGRQSVFLTKLNDPEHPERAQRGGEENAISYLWVPAGASRIELEGLWFEGEAPANLRPDQFLTNLQGACIEIGWGFGGAPAATDVTIRRCGFVQQYGFSVHARADAARIDTIDCDMIDCMNGSNINARDSQHLYWRVRRSEGFEHSGSNVQIAFNRIRQFHVVGISFGGHTGPGIHENRSYGGRVIGNVVDEGDGHGVEITTNTSDTLVQGNFVSRTRTAGMAVGGGVEPGNQARRVILDGNQFLDCGGPNETLALYVAGVDGAKIRGNWARRGEWPGFNQAFGLVVSGCTDVEIDETNEFNGSMDDIRIGRGNARLRLPERWPRHTKVSIEPGGA